MNFIIPQNFNFKNKFLGLIDYPTLILDFIYLIFLNSLLNIINFTYTYTQDYYLLCILDVLLQILF